VATVRSLLGIRLAREGEGVTTLELFFDLVYVFAFTQVSALMAHGEPPGSVLDGAIVLALLWWTWCSYAWLANMARGDVGVVRLALVLATAIMFVAGLAIPESFHDLPGGLYGPMVLVVCYALVRLVHLGVYLVVAGDDARLRRQVLVSLATSAGPASVLLVVGALLHEPWQRWVWLAAVVYDLLVIFVTSRGGGGWVLSSAAHFAERHGLIVILALGESIVAIGVGAAEKPVSLPIVLAAVLAVAIAVGTWVHYFQGVAPHLEHALLALSGRPRAQAARDVYTYLHLPVVAGIILSAFGVEQAVAHLGEHHLGAHAAWALGAGLALTLAALEVAGRRVGLEWSRWRAAGVAGLLLAPALLAGLPSAVMLSVVALVMLVTGVGARVEVTASPMPGPGTASTA
jgi:low temperature requirement protein LtrA